MRKGGSKNNDFPSGQPRKRQNIEQNPCYEILANRLAKKQFIKAIRKSLTPIVIRLMVRSFIAHSVGWRTQARQIPSSAEALWLPLFCHRYPRASCQTCFHRCRFRLLGMFQFVKNPLGELTVTQNRNHWSYELIQHILPGKYLRCRPLVPQVM